MRKLTAIAVALGFLAATSLPTLAAPAVSGATTTLSAQPQQDDANKTKPTTTKKTKKTKVKKVKVKKVKIKKVKIKKHKVIKKHKIKKPKTKKPVTDNMAPKTDSQPK